MSISFRRAAICTALAAASALGVSAQVGAQNAPKASITLDVRAAGKLGDIIVDGKGMSLYMFTPDRPNVSNCEGACLNVWPPVMLGKGETLANVELLGGLRRSKLGVAMRFDGTQQVTYNGYPLYWWVQDKVAGDVKGQYVQNVWFVLSPSGTPNSDHA